MDKNKTLVDSTTLKPVSRRAYVGNTSNAIDKMACGELEAIKKELKDLTCELRTHRKVLTRTISETNSYRKTSNEGDCRYLAEDAPRRKPLSPKLTGPEDAIRFCEDYFRWLIQKGLQEEVHLLTLDGQNRVFKTHQITVGILNSAQVHPREVFRPAILGSAQSIILVHNHPSGVSEPSKEDLKITELIKSSGKILGIHLLDHIVIASEGSRSILEWDDETLLAKCQLKQ